MLPNFQCDQPKSLEGAGYAGPFKCVKAVCGASCSRWAGCRHCPPSGWGSQPFFLRAALSAIAPVQVSCPGVPVLSPSTALPHPSLLCFGGLAEGWPLTAPCKGAQVVRELTCRRKKKNNFFENTMCVCLFHFLFHVGLLCCFFFVVVSWQGEQHYILVPRGRVLS